MSTRRQIFCGQGKMRWQIELPQLEIAPTWMYTIRFTQRNLARLPSMSKGTDGLLVGLAQIFYRPPQIQETLRVR